MFECSSGTGIRQYNLDGLVGCLYVSTHGCLAVVGKSYEHQPPQLPNLEYGGTCVFLSTLGSAVGVRPSSPRPHAWTPSSPGFHTLPRVVRSYKPLLLPGTDSSLFLPTLKDCEAVAACFCLSHASSVIYRKKKFSLCSISGIRVLDLLRLSPPTDDPDFWSFFSCLSSVSVEVKMPKPYSCGSLLNRGAGPNWSVPAVNCYLRSIRTMEEFGHFM